MTTLDLVKLIKTNNFEEFNLERENSNFKEIIFKNINFSNLILKFFKFDNCLFYNCNLIVSNFDNCNINYSNFDKCNINNSKFYNCNLRYSKFYKCYLNNSKFDKCKLNESKFNNCDLRQSKFDDCDLRYSKFDNCDLRYSKVDKCNLFDSKFDYCELIFTKFIECDLSGTCLDSNNIPNRITNEFKKDGDYIIGYRTKYSIIGDYYYKEGKEYEAEIFSTSDEDCHPGLYLAPSIDNLKNVLEYNGPYVKVWAKPEDTHKSGKKYRTKKFYKVIDV